MLGIRYAKFPPTTYVLHHRGGRLVREGPGLAFFYWSPGSTLTAIPLASVDLPFAFQEATADFQIVTIQGQITFRVADPKRLAALLDYSIHPDGTPRSEDPEKLAERIVHEAQVQTRAAIKGLDLRRLLTSADVIAPKVAGGLRTNEAVSMLGVEILGVQVLSVKPSPEMAKALEAEAREALQRNADAAIYDRRNAAVEQERRIKENELRTELAVEEKRREIRETQMAAEIAVEEQRAKLVEQKTENDRKEADMRAYALEANLKPLRQTDWRSLLAVNGIDPRAMIALAFRDLAENAQKIGELNMSPDLLTSLMKERK